MNLSLWMYFDPRSLGLTLSLSAALLALVLIITNHARGRRLPGMHQAATGMLLASGGFALNMLQAWLPPLVGMAIAVLLILVGLTLIQGGICQLRAQPPHWGPLSACCLVGLGIALWFGVVTPDVRWRIGLLSLLMAGLALLVVRTALAEKRAQHLAGMRLLALLGVVFAALMSARALAAFLGMVESSVSLSPVNATAVVAAGMSLIGGVVGLVLVFSGDLMALVQHQREHDALTDLFNRQGLRQWIEHLPPGLPLALGMVDLDHFKQINDLHGHDLGDQVIRHLATLLQEYESPACCAARLGGEEFVIIVQGQDTTQALARDLEGLRERFQQTGPLPGSSFSAGVARGTAAGFEAALRQADAALYRAKQAGRNRVELA